MRYVYFGLGWLVLAIAVSWLFSLLSANDTAAQRDSLDDELAALRARSNKRRAERERFRTDLRQRDGGDHAA